MSERRQLILQPGRSDLVWAATRSTGATWAEVHP